MVTGSICLSLNVCDFIKTVYSYHGLSDLYVSRHKKRAVRLKNVKLSLLVDLIAVPFLF